MVAELIFALCAGAALDVRGLPLAVRGAAQEGLCTWLVLIAGHAHCQQWRLASGSFSEWEENIWRGLY